MKRAMLFVIIVLLLAAMLAACTEAVHTFRVVTCDGQTTYVEAAKCVMSDAGAVNCYSTVFKVEDDLIIQFGCVLVLERVDE